MCLHCPTLILMSIPMKLVTIIMFGNGYSGPMQISILIPIPMPMGTVLNLALVSVPIRWFLTDFHCYLASESPSNVAFLHIIGNGIGIGQCKHTIKISFVKSVNS